MDPVVSALITMIIVKATIPLVKSASFILLQGTPPSVSVDILRKDILKLKGVADVHELHVWQLSNTQTIASVHVVVPRPVGTSTTPYDEDWYMDLAARIKNLLHSHGIHSTTVQPEFVTCESPGSGLPVPL